MGESHMTWLHATARQLPTQADQDGQAELDLMPIEVPGNTDVFNHYPNICAFKIFQGQAFIGHRAVSRHPSQGLTQNFGRGWDVVKQSQLSKIGLMSEVKSEKLVLQRVR